MTMPKPARRPSTHRRTSGPTMPEERVALFLEQLTDTGSVHRAAATAGLKLGSLYARRRRNKRFAAKWAQALEPVFDRLRDEGLGRALEGEERPVFRNGREVGTVRHYDNRLLRDMLRDHAAQLARARAAAETTAADDFARRLADAEKRAAILDARRATGQIPALAPRRKRRE